MARSSAPSSTAGGLSGLHAQDPHGRLLRCLCPQASLAADGRSSTRSSRPQLLCAHPSDDLRDGGGVAPGQYEFQCLHGMGETLYEKSSARPNSTGRAASTPPVGTHETLLAISCARLLENGANTSFVTRSPTRIFRSTGCSAIRWRWPPHWSLSGCRIRRSPCRAPSSARCGPIRAASSQRRTRARVACRDDHRRPRGGLARAAACWRADRAMERPRRAQSRDLSDIVGHVVEASPEIVDAACAYAEPWHASTQARAECLDASPTAWKRACRI